VLVARWLLGVVMQGACRAFHGRAQRGPGHPVRAEDLALTGDLSNRRVPKFPGKPNLSRSFSGRVAGGVRVREVAVVKAGGAGPRALRA
jgi:hypothetical protein